MKWTVGAKIGTGFGLALAILAIIAVVAYRSTNKLIDSADWVAHTHQVLESLGGVIQAFTDAETGQRGFIITGQEQYLEPYNSGIAVVDQHVAQLRNLTVDSPIQQQRLDVLEPLVKQRLALLKEGIDIQKDKGSQAAHEWVQSGKGKEEMDQIRSIIGAMREEELSLLKQRDNEAQVRAESTRLVIVLGTICALVILSSVGFFVTRNISGPLREITNTAGRIASGDLEVSIATRNRQDEVGVLAQTFTHMIGSLRAMADVARNIADGDLRTRIKPQSDKDILGNTLALMVENLRRLTGQIAEGVNVLSTSANQISTSTTQLAAGASETASAVTETTTTVEEVRQTAQVASEKSRHVSESAQKVALTAQAGQEATQGTIGEMERIRKQMVSVADSMVRLSEQSQSVGQIIASVDDLSAQSNLLAVNAAIEAAKAGEHGKGFAVVAQEIRSLSEQSKQATNQVRGILSDIQKATSAAVMASEQGTKAVEAGVKQSGHAGQSIQTLSSSVSEAAQAATQIAASSQQQLVGVDQVATAMENIKQASSQNVASAKQLESAAQNLKELGQKLSHLVAQYKV